MDVFPQSMDELEEEIIEMQNSIKKQASFFQRSEEKQQQPKMSESDFASIVCRSFEMMQQRFAEMSKKFDELNHKENKENKKVNNYRPNIPPPQIKKQPLPYKKHQGTRTVEKIQFKSIRKPGTQSLTKITKK